MLPYCLPSAPSVSYFHTLLHSFANLSSQNVKKLRSTFTKSCSALHHIHVVGLADIFHLSLFSLLSTFSIHLSLASFTIPYTFFFLFLFCLLWLFPNYFLVLYHIFWLWTGITIDRAIIYLCTCETEKDQARFHFLVNILFPWLYFFKCFPPFILDSFSEWFSKCSLQITVWQQSRGARSMSHVAFNSVCS